MSNENSHHAAWRKASYSNGSGSCVEVGQTAGRVAVRDTKQAHLKDDDRTVVRFTPESWGRFTADLNNANL